jgi:hypothetical protein
MKREVMWANSKITAIRYGNWLCYFYANGEAEWWWEPVDSIVKEQ